MGKVTGGLGIDISGSVGNLTFSKQADGSTTVKEKNGKSDIPLTVNQESVVRDTTITAAFMKPLTDFVKVGYELQAKIQKQNAYNTMVIHVRRDTLIGEYPKRMVDFSKVLVTQGKMEPPEDAVVALNEYGLSFSWNTEINNRGDHYSDQVMMMAYFPELKKTRYMTAGAQRNQGKDILMLSGIKRGYVAEIYISFIADNRKNISNSIYLGQLIW